MTQSLSVVVLSAGLDDFNQLRGALTADSRVQLLAGGTDIEQIHDEVVRLKPAAAIITLGANSDQAINLIQRLTTECPATTVISAAQETSPGLILQSLRAGAREFLRLPIKAEELKTVLDRISQSSVAPIEPLEPPKKKGRMIAVFSSKGGCGTSFIATNLAAYATARTLLVDLNLQAGDLPLLLGVDPKHSLASMVDNHARLDDELISALVTPCSPNLHLISAPKEADFFDKIRPEHVVKVLERLREAYDYVVLDPQHTFDAITVAALDQSDEIVLVLTLDIPAIRSTQRSLQIFDRLGYPRRKVRIVVNRWSKQVDVDLREVEKALGEPVLGSVQSDYQTAVRSINLGKPLIKSDSSSKMAREITHIAQKLYAGMVHIEEAKPRRGWSSFLKRGPAEKG